SYVPPSTHSENLSLSQQTCSLLTDLGDIELVAFFGFPSTFPSPDLASSGKDLGRSFVRPGCYSGSCPENWAWNRGNCYYISTEAKTWLESQTACRSMNSSLLKIEDREELQDFLKLLKSFYWTGLSRRGPDEPWLWLDGSGLSHDLSVQNVFPWGNCVFYRLEGEFTSENCTYSTLYICELRAT
uniref:Natural killer cells antigen CD94 n=1 Tax=Ornithorhynchus anatinus TaxID=9258 RepID=F6SVH9_ORNAN